jgi:hypothetical protein
MVEGVRLRRVERRIQLQAAQPVRIGDEELAEGYRVGVRPCSAVALVIFSLAIWVLGTEKSLGLPE